MILLDEKDNYKKSFEVVLGI